ncbi:MAG: hypothetical protein HWD82_09430 [Flavobacteriaceae bacterium]|nr:hypothetical protein [Flavobacteriaceae bacterium]
MKKHILKLLLILVILVSQFSISQNRSIDSAFVNYFKDTRELPFLHLNKTSFLRGEEIWFQAYVLEQNSKKPHPATTNLYVEVFNANGRLKQESLVRIKDGLGKGNILIDSTFTEEFYYIKASTNWMRNFKEENTFVQKIKIISNTKKQFETTNANAYDFQVFPEGGHLLSNIENTVGVLIKDQNGKGIALKNIKLKDKKGTLIKTFETNFLGLAKVEFTYEKDNYYTMEVELSNGDTITTNLPEAKKSGVNLKVINPNTNITSFILCTNSSTLPDLIGKTYSVFIHNTNTYFKKDITFQSEFNSYSLFIKNDNFAYGTNIVTVFDNNKNPVLERVFFNYNKNLFADVSVTSSIRETDSINISLTNNSESKIHLSSSFLPEQTKAYKPDNNIYTAFLLKPYIKGEVQNADYYFKDINRKKLYNLDLLLLTQGWSKYQWNTIFNENTTPKFEFEIGVKLEGKFNNPPRKSNVFMLSYESNIMKVIDLKDNSFEFKNLFLEKDTDLYFGIALENKSKQITPSVRFIKNQRLTFLDRIFIKNTNVTKELEVSNFDDLKIEGEMLDEFEMVFEKRPVFENNPFGYNTMGTGFKMKNMVFDAGFTVIDFLQEKRYNIIRENGVIVGIAPRRAGTQNAFGAGSGAATNGLAPYGLQVFLDGMILPQAFYQDLDTMFLDEISEVFLTEVPSGFLGGSQIHIYRLPPSELVKNVKGNPLTKINVTHGFAKEKEYYQPQYPSYIEKTYKDFGAVYWKPNITIDQNSNTSFNIPRNSQKQIKLFLEGITKDGKIVSKEMTLKTTEN